MLNHEKNPDNSISKKMTKQLTMLILIVSSFLGCTAPMSNKDFVEKCNLENFEVFKNTSMFIRSGAHDGGIIVFAYDETIPPSLDNGAYVIHVNDKEKRIISASCHLMKDSTIVDKKRLQQLVLKFIEYPIGYLDVDSNNNVLINLRANTSPNLVRFSDKKYKEKEAVYRNWKPIKDNWYEKTAQ